VKKFDLSAVSIRIIYYLFVRHYDSYIREEVLDEGMHNAEIAHNREPSRDANCLSCALGADYQEETNEACHEICHLEYSI
jgi:hypothetical protein